MLWREAISQKSDVLSIQETHTSKFKSPKCSHCKFMHYFFVNTDTKRKGVFIAVSISISFQLHYVEVDHNDQFIILHLF